MNSQDQRSSPASVADDSDAALADLLPHVVELCRCGELASLAQVVERYPAHAERLASIWPAVQGMIEWGDAARSDYPLNVDSAATVELPAEGVLGDFQILHEIGRGGMGVVYQAQQLSLKRRVALKVLPLAAMLDPRRLQRFQNEAQAAAGLHHGHIVPVYAVGCERGVHYYAMQYIQGQTLAQVVAELAAQRQERQGDEERGRQGEVDSSETVPQAKISTDVSNDPQEWHRTVARVGIEVAEALDHAHGLGVTHRDIKPSNLMLDAQGNAWVTDFGLAHIENEASLTMTGDVLGTLRYMSPEQALGRRGVLDHRTDIYSLGITLYELLALRPAFTSDNRAQLVRQIAEDEPPRLRRIQRSVPRDLETIVCKALAKDPADRYATAAELADDLRRHLTDQPIKARKLTVYASLIRAAQRRIHAVLAACAALMVISIGLSVAAILIAQARAEARRNLSEAQQMTKRATTNFYFALHAIGELQEVPDTLTEGAQIKTAVREKSRELYLRFVDSTHHDAEARLQTATAFIRIAKTLKISSNNVDWAVLDQKIADLTTAIGLLETVQKELPDDIRCRRELAAGYSFLAASTAQKAGRDAKPDVPPLRNVLDEAALAQSRTAIGHFKSYIDMPEAMIPDFWVYQDAWESLGQHLAWLGDLKQAAEAFLNAAEACDKEYAFRQRTAGSTPEGLRFPARRGFNTRTMALQVYQWHGDHAAAARVARETIAAYEGLPSAVVALFQPPLDIRRVRFALGDALVQLAQHDEADDAYAKAAQAPFALQAQPASGKPEPRGVTAAPEPPTSSGGPARQPLPDDHTKLLAGNADLARQLIGNWVLVGKPGKIVEPPKTGGRFLMFTGQNFTVIVINPSTGKMDAHLSGTYTIEGDELTETVLLTDEGTAAFRNKVHRFKSRIEGDTYTQIGIGNQFTEVWRRLK